MEETYRGVPNSIFIWHGEWSDPEVLYKGISLNVNDIEDGLWYSYKDTCEENNTKPTEEDFEDWLNEIGTEYIVSTLNDIAESMKGFYTQ